MVQLMVPLKPLTQTFRDTHSVTHSTQYTHNSIQAHTPHITVMGTL